MLEASVPVPVAAVGDLWFALFVALPALGPGDDDDDDDELGGGGGSGGNIDPDDDEGYDDDDDEDEEPLQVAPSRPNVAVQTP